MRAVAGADGARVLPTPEAAEMALRQYLASIGQAPPPPPPPLPPPAAAAAAAEQKQSGGGGVFSRLLTPFSSSKKDRG